MNIKSVTLIYVYIHLDRKAIRLAVISAIYYLCDLRISDSHLLKTRLLLCQIGIIRCPPPIDERMG